MMSTWVLRDTHLYLHRSVSNALVFVYVALYNGSRDLDRPKEHTIQSPIAELFLLQAASWFSFWIKLIQKRLEFDISIPLKVFNELAEVEGLSFWKDPAPGNLGLSIWHQVFGIWHHNSKEDSWQEQGIIENDSGWRFRFRYTKPQPQVLCQISDNGQIGQVEVSQICVVMVILPVHPGSVLLNQKNQTKSSDFVIVFIFQD